MTNKSVVQLYYQTELVKSQSVLVFAKGDKIAEAEAAGADYVGEAEYVQKNPTRLVRLRCSSCYTRHDG